MNTHQVTLNGHVVAVGQEHFKLLTMVRSFEHHDRDGNKVARHELVMDGVDATGREVTQIVPSLPLKKGDVIQVLIG